MFISVEVDEITWYINKSAEYVMEQFFTVYDNNKNKQYNSFH